MKEGNLKNQTFWVWFFCFVFSSILYLLTCQRGVSWQDSGMFQWRILNGDITGNLGIALAHPLYIIFGKLFAMFPWGDTIMRLNFFSGIGMSIAVANLSVVLFILTEKRWIGFMIAAIFALTHTAWWLATIAEVYALSLAGLSIELWLLILLFRTPKWYLLASLAFVSGLGLAVHNLALLPLPVYGIVTWMLFQKGYLPTRSLALAGFCYLAGSAPFWTLIIALALRSGNIWYSLQSAFWGRFASSVFNINPLSANFKINAMLMAMNFVNLLVPLAIVGWIHFRKQLGTKRAYLIGAMTLIEFIFALRYDVPDQFTFFLPSLYMIALAAGVGLNALIEDTARASKASIIFACLISIIIQPVFYAISPRLIYACGFTVERQRMLPFRDEMRYWLVPWKQNERSAELFAQAALTQAEPDGVILADGTSMYPLLLMQRLKNKSPYVSIQHNNKPLPNYALHSQAFRQQLGNRRLYVVSPLADYIPRPLIQDAEFVRSPQEVLYLVRWKKAT